MGNQPGANQYQYPQSGSQIGQQTTFPYGTVPTSGNYQGATPSFISNYYQQGYPPAKWPSLFNIPPQQSQLQQPNVSNFKGSYINDPSIKGSQINQRGSQLNNNVPINYGNTIQAVQYADQINLNPSFLNNRNNQTTFSNQQKVSNISLPTAPQQNPSQLPYNPSQVQQMQSHLQSQLSQAQVNSQLPNQK